MRILAQSEKGLIGYCKRKDLYKVEFGNMLFQFSQCEFSYFRQYIFSLDYEYYLGQNRNTFNRRKLLLNIGSRNVFFCLNKNEILELRNLLECKNTLKKMTEVKSAEFPFNLN